MPTKICKTLQFIKIFWPFLAMIKRKKLFINICDRILTFLLNDLNYYQEKLFMLIYFIFKEITYNLNKMEQDY